MRIGLFLTIALLLGGLATTILALGGGAGWEEALLLGLPLGLVEGAIVLAARYPCQSAPLRASGMTRALATQATAALASAGAWVVFGGILARILETFPRYGGAAIRFRPVCCTASFSAFSFASDPLLQKNKWSSPAGANAHSRSAARVRTSSGATFE